MPSTPRNRAEAAALASAAVTGLIAFALFLGGALLLWANAHYKDADGYLSTGSARVASDTYAISTADLDAGRFARAQYGTLRLSARAQDKPVFIGLARTRDLDAYLRDVAHSEVTDVEVGPFRTKATEHAGTRRPTRPATRDIWAASAHGDHTQTLTWDVAQGDWSVVVMNEDGSPGVTTAVSAGAKVPYLLSLGWGTLALGLAFVVATATLTLYGTRPAPRRRLAPA